MIRKRGVPVNAGAEIRPIEPEAVHTVEGKMLRFMVEGRESRPLVPAYCGT